MLLINFLEDLELYLGFLIANKKPKKDTFLMGKNRIIILSFEEINRIPEIIDRVCGEMAHHVGLQNQN